MQPLVVFYLGVRPLEAEQRRVVGVNGEGSISFKVLLARVATMAACSRQEDVPGLGMRDRQKFQARAGGYQAVRAEHRTQVNQKRAALQRLSAGFYDEKNMIHWSR